MRNNSLNITMKKSLQRIHSKQKEIFEELANKRMEKVQD